MRAAPTGHAQTGCAAAQTHAVIVHDITGRCPGARAANLRVVQRQIAAALAKPRQILLLRFTQPEHRSFLLQEDSVDAKPTLPITVKEIATQPEGPVDAPQTAAIVVRLVEVIDDVLPIRANDSVSRG
jgi:hypothetical protein